jgi:hypothetical protein|tara:strand:- start:544 stop:750 length:207 start_codon:yes stop_codon:yes gene_type:complete
MALSEVFWIAFVGTASGFLLKLASLAYKSKCKECSACGVWIRRDVDAEVEMDEFNRLNPAPPSPKETV